MTNELATTNNASASIIPDGSFSTVDATTFEGAMRVTNAINNSESLNDYVIENKNPTMTVVDIVVTNGIRKARKSGEEDTPCEDTRLILADGTSLLSQSDGIAKSAKMIAGFCGAELHNGLLIRVVARELRNGNTIKNLEVVGKA